MRSKLFLMFLILLFSSTMSVAGTTGKIAGTVVDGETGMPLPGVNIIISGTTLGAATNVDGYYVILNVPPGKYAIKATMIGYTPHEVKEVRVQIDLTTNVNIKLKAMILEGEEVVVVAERSVVKKDVAASQKSVSSDDIEALPVTSVGEVMGLQAGITSGMSIRGGGSSETLFMVDGIVLRDERSNQPMSVVPLSAVQEISVQTGGFSAEYNNVRSGVVNVVTREGDKNRYTGSLTYKIKPPQPKHFDISPFDPNSYWLRPYTDPEVAWDGTGAWDQYTQRQYPKWDGWNAFSAGTLKDDDPTNDLTPEAAQQIFLWQHRKQGDIKDPDYYIDAGFGGPVPFISKSLGNLRFFSSYRREKNMYLMQMSRDAYTDQSFMTKVTSDISPAMKLNIIAIYGETFATTLSRSGGTSFMSSTWGVASSINTSSFTVPWRIYTNTYYAPTARYSHTLSAKLTHVLSPRTFYEVQLKKVGRKYYTNTGPLRDETPRYEVYPGHFENEAPIGFEPEAVFSVEGRLGMGGAVSTSRDYSKISTYSAKFDLVHQLGSHNQIKTGAEFVYDDFNMGFGMVNYFLPEGNTWTTIKRKPFRGSFYLQDKIEFEGWISTLGLIAEYADPNGNWFDIDLYSRDFFSQNFQPDLEAQYMTKKANGKFTLSPRLSVSHPITENSKLYFNYGHFRQMPTSQNLYRVQRAINNQMDYVGDPTLPLARTISYELGYDHAIYKDYLLHLAAYYKDITDQELYVRYISFDDKVNYRKLTNNSYEDIRGFEVDITKMYGEWITGNINYEYRVNTAGYFGSLLYYESAADQREYLRRNPIQSKPRPTPRIKSNIDVHTPLNFGPEFVGQRILGNWHLNFLSRWTAGSWFTWNPNNIPGIQYNTQWKSYKNVDLKISKIFPVGKIDFKFFVDIYNLFNTRDFSGISFRDIHDRNYYFESLHLPEDVAGNLEYNNIPGNDQPGDYRKIGVEYQPIEWVNSITDPFTPNSRAIYYEATTKKYMQFTNSQWQEVSSSRMDQILEDKAYIDMPNQSFFTFLNPRGVFFGITLNYRF